MTIQSMDTGHRYSQPVVIAAAVVAGACLDAVWPQFIRGVVLALKIAFGILMSNR